jgi:hypothetical protein
MSFRVNICNFMSFHAIQVIQVVQVILFHVTLYHFMSFMSVMSCHVMSCHFMSFHVSMEFSDQLSIKLAGVRGQGGQICLPRPSATVSLSGQRQKYVLNAL